EQGERRDPPGCRLRESTDHPGSASRADPGIRLPTCLETLDRGSFLTTDPQMKRLPAHTTMLMPTSTMNTAKTLRSAGPLIACAMRVPSGAASTDPIAMPIAAGTKT